MVIMLAAVGVVVGFLAVGFAIYRSARLNRWADPMLLFNEADAFPGPRARRWAYGVLHEAGVDADSDPRYAAEMLCNAEPRLRPRDAQTLIQLMGGPL